MARYALRKLLYTLPLAWAVATISFLLLELAPGDASATLVPAGASPAVRAAILDKWQLQAPLWERYLAALGNLFTGELGISVVRERPVAELLWEALPATLALTGTALLVMVLLGLLLGSLQALRRGSWLDRVATLASVALHAMPGFWLATVLVMVFAIWWPVLPVSQAADPMAAYLPFTQRLLDRARHLLLPALALEPPTPRWWPGTIAPPCWRSWAAASCAPPAPRGWAPVACCCSTPCATRCCPRSRCWGCPSPSCSRVRWWWSGSSPGPAWAR